MNERHGGWQMAGQPRKRQSPTYVPVRTRGGSSTVIHPEGQTRQVQSTSPALLNNWDNLTGTRTIEYRVARTKNIDARICSIVFHC